MLMRLSACDRVAWGQAPFPSRFYRLASLLYIAQAVHNAKFAIRLNTFFNASVFNLWP